MPSVRPLGSIRVTGLLRYYGPLRLPTEPPRRLCLPAARWSLALPPCRASQAPRLIFPRALSPTTPEGPASANACCFLTGVFRLHPARRTGHLRLANEAESGLLHYGSRVRRPSSRQLHYWNSRSFGYMQNRQLHGELLSVHKISQAYPGIPRVSERFWLRLCCFVGQPIMAAAAFRGGSALDQRNRSCCCQRAA